MDYEIEFHPVGDGTKAGDAISVRYRDQGVLRVIVIDGGTIDCGKAMVAHIKKFYGPETVISDVVSTHPDNDHASGLREVLNEFKVERLWIHGLWHHAAEMLPYFEDAWTVGDLQQTIKDEYSIVDELINLAASKGTLVYEPFSGQRIGPFIVLSPSKDAYIKLVPQFRRTPTANKTLLETAAFWLGAPKQSFLSSILEKVTASVTQWIPESWELELLKENPTTAAENDSSTVLLGHFSDRKAILTGDAGVHALNWACDYADFWGLDRTSPNLIQVPHHGSRSNVSPSILDRMIGVKLTAGSAAIRTAVVSCPKDDAKHPRKMVINAFLRRGCAVYKTQGNYIRHHHGNMPERGSEVPASGFSWFNEVEAYD